MVGEGEGSDLGGTLHRYHGWPFRLLQFQYSAEAQHELFQMFLEAPACCLDEWISTPLRSRVSSAEQMINDPEFLALLRHLSRRAVRSTNMHVEGLLSEHKAAVPEGRGSANAEKVAYLAHLSQVLKQHFRAGWRDCRGELRRAELVHRGVPVEPHSDERSRRSPADPAASPDEMPAQLPAAVAVATESGPLHDDGHADPWDFGDMEYPLRPTVLTEFLRSHDAVPVTKARREGVASKASLIRRHEAPSLLVKDEGLIDDDHVFEHRLSCSEAHPGLCAFRDHAIYDTVLALAANIQRALLKKHLHSYIEVRDPGKDRIAIHIQGWSRGGGCGETATMTPRRFEDSSKRRCIFATGCSRRLCNLGYGQSLEDSLPVKFLYFARLRARRHHSQVTHTLVKCEQHFPDRSLSLAQRRLRCWHFVSVWGVARELLVEGYTCSAAHSDRPRPG